MRKKNKLLRLSIFCFFLIFIQHASFSQLKDSVAFHKNPILTDRFTVNLGFFTISKSVRMRVDGNMPNGPIDFGETLGLEKRDNTFAFNSNWRFSKEKKWSLRLEYFSENNKGTAVLEREIDWGDTTYPAGVSLDYGFGFKMFGLVFSRLISQGDKHEFTAGLGIHTMNINTFLQGKAFIGDMNFEYQLDTEKRRLDIIAPIPSLGVRYIYAPHYRWSMSARVDWFSITVGDYSGTLWNLAPSASFRIFDNFGIGIGYKYFHTKFNFEKNILRGRTDLLYQGPLISISGSF